MFEQAKILRDKFLIPAEAQRSLKILEEQANLFREKISVVKSKISILEREIYLVETDLDEFLMDYYERVSTLFLNNGDEQETLFERCFTIADSSVIDGEIENFNLYSKKEEAEEKELKKIYRKLVKISHPDSGSLYSSYQHSKPDFAEINRLYKQGDIVSLYNIEQKYFEDESSEDETLVRVIELYEAKLAKLDKTLENLVAKISTIVDSSEYKLFLKKKYADIRGEDFFANLIK